MYAHEPDHKGRRIQRNPVHEVRETNGPRLPSGCDLGIPPELSNQSKSIQSIGDVRAQLVQWHLWVEAWQPASLVK